MTTLNLTALVPPALTGFTVTGGLQAAALKWDATPIVTDKYQVFKNTVNNQSTATLFATVESNAFTPQGLANSTDHFFWVRTINEFGTVGPLVGRDEPSTGAFYNPLFFYVLTVSDVSATNSVQTVKANIHYTPLNGAPTSTGFIVFTSTVQNAAGAGFLGGGTAWTNPDNARADDANSATVALTFGFSKGLKFTCADALIPATAIITGVQYEITGQTTAFLNTAVWMRFGDTNGVVSPTVSTPVNASFTANNTTQTLTVGTSSTLYWPFGTGIPLVQAELPGSLALTGGGISGSFTGNATSNIANYGTYFAAGSVTFTVSATGIYSFSLSMFCTYEATSITCTGGQQLAIDTLISVYDDTANDSAPGSVYNRIYFNDAGDAYGSTKGVLNITTELSNSYARELIAGHSYTVSLNVSKVRVTGSPVMTLAIRNSSVQTISFTSS